MVAQYLGFRQQFELLTEAPIHWPNNAGPTENKPECGFVGELCYSYCKLLTQDFSEESVPKNFIFLFLNQNICCGYSNEPSQ